MLVDEDAQAENVLADLIGQWRTLTGNVRLDDGPETPVQPQRRAIRIAASVLAAHCRIQPPRRFEEGLRLRITGARPETLR